MAISDMYGSSGTNGSFMLAFGCMVELLEHLFHSTANQYTDIRIDTPEIYPNSFGAGFDWYWLGYTGTISPAVVARRSDCEWRVG